MKWTEAMYVLTTLVMHIWEEFFRDKIQRIACVDHILSLNAYKLIQWNIFNIQTWLTIISDLMISILHRLIGVLHCMQDKGLEEDDQMIWMDGAGHYITIGIIHQWDIITTYDWKAKTSTYDCQDIV